MTAWAPFAVAGLFFFASHMLPLRPRVRRALVARLGARGFGVLYGGLSVGALAWVIAAASSAPYIQLWPSAPWQRAVTWAALALACLLIAFTLGRPNPFSFGGTSARFDPTRAGLLRVYRHPLLLALALWALGHLVANGDLAHALMFGSFAVFALAGGTAIDRRKRRALGPEWETMWHSVQSTPITLPPLREVTLRLLAALALFAGLVAAHPWVIGVSPLW